MFRRPLIVAAMLMLAACATRPALDSSPRTTPSDTKAVSPEASATDPTWPVDVQGYRTTAGSIYVGNLDARIDELGRVLARSQLAVHRTALAGSLFHRYRVVGRIEDARRALALLDEAVAAEPDVAEHRQIRAVVLAGFHRFDEALADLDAAQRAGTPEAALQRTRREILLARGDYAALADDFAHSSEFAPGFDELAHRADLQVLQGHPQRAELLYRAAQTQYRDVNPVPLAWLHLQQGIAHLRHGRIEDARRFFAAAHARLPQYYLATEHLAECETLLGNHDVARDLYRGVIAQTGNPEFIAALAGLERAAGNEAEATRLAREAEQGYVALLRENPAAYAQHAAEFFIEFGQAARADQLARDNLEVRQDIGSWILQAQTALAVDDAPRACDARRRALAFGFKPPELAELDALQARCP